MSSISSSFSEVPAAPTAVSHAPCPLDLHLPLVDASLSSSLSLCLLLAFVAMRASSTTMSGDKPWSLRPRKSDGLAATSIASGYSSSQEEIVEGPPSANRVVFTNRTSARVSSGSSVSYIDSGSGSGSEDDDLPDPATLLAFLPNREVQGQKAVVDAMDVDEEPAAPPNKKANRAGKGGSAVSNAETPLKAKERPLPRPKFSGARSTGNATWILDARLLLAPVPSTLTRSSSRKPCASTIPFDLNQPFRAVGYIPHVRVRHPGRRGDGRTYKPLEAKDPATFRKTMDYFSMPGFALSRTGEWLHSNGGSLPELVILQHPPFILVTVRYRYGAIDPMEPLPSDPNHQIFFDAFPPFDGQRHLVMNKYDEAWAEYRRKFAEHEASENGKEAAFTARQRPRIRNGRSAAHLPREDPEVHKHQSQRILEYIGLRQKVLSDVEHRLNTLGAISYSGFARNSTTRSALGSPRSHHRRAADSVVLAQPRKGCCGAPAIAVLEAAPASDSDDEPLSASRDAKSKGRKKAAERASSERAASDHAESDEGEQSDGEEEDPITRSVKVKRGGNGTILEWHAANDLFVYAWPTTASGNKIVTHGYPFDEKHPRFLGDVEAPDNSRQPSSARLLYAWQGMRAVLLGTEQLYSPALWGGASNRSVRPLPRGQRVLRSLPVEFDWRYNGNAEYFELQQALMLDIAEEVAPAGTTSASLASYSVNFACLVRGRPNGGASRSLRGRLCRTPRQPLRVQVERRVHAGGMTKGSATEVDEKVEDEENAAMPPASESGVSNEGPPPSRARASLDVDAPAALPLRLSLGAPDSASLRPPSDPVQLFSPAVPSRRSNTPDRARRASSRLVRPYRRVLDARPDSSIFGKPGPVLGGNSSETSEESASVTFRWVKRTQRARSRARESSRARRGGGEMNVD
ncbi:hypothetical protein B0H13DRAFT_2370019 [Mycena leptocephala]|nr:hypothetical protein B0H13DRAFT_2370019 [Mycena leptocephala]